MEKKRMHDKQVDELMTQYAESLGHFEGEVPAPKRGWAPFWRPMAATAAGLAVVTVLVFAPRQAEAAPMEKVVSALGEVGYWRADSWAKTVNIGTARDWSHHSVQTYWNGVMQFESPVNRKDRLVMTVEGAWVYHDYERAPYILKWPFKDEAFSVPFKDPLKHALSMTGGRPERMKRADVAPYKGQEAYSLSLTDKNGLHTFKAIIAKSSNLPLFATMALGNKGEYQYKTEYRYDAPTGKSGLFVATGKTIIDGVKVLSDLKTEWGRVRAVNGKPTVYGGTVAKDGSIWVAYEASTPAPSAIKGGGYVRGATYSLSAMQAERRFLINGKKAVATRFLPVDGVPAVPSSVSVEFAKSTVSVELTEADWDYPRYLPVFVTFYQPEYEELTKLVTVALHWTREKDFKRAVSTFDRYFEVMGRLGGYDRVSGSHAGFRAGPYVYEQAALAYEKVGNKARAAELRKMADRVRKPG